MNRDCYNCDWFVTFDGAVCVCCRHKLEIVPHEGNYCTYWTPSMYPWDDEDDDIHDNDAMDWSKQTDTLNVPDKE